MHKTRLMIMASKYDIEENVVKRKKGGKCNLIVGSDSECDFWFEPS
jgi:hypothetical protein